MPKNPAGIHLTNCHRICGNGVVIVYYTFERDHLTVTAIPFLVTHPQQLTPDSKRVRQCSEQMPWIRPDSPKWDDLVLPLRSEAPLEHPTPNPLHFSNVRWPTFWRRGNCRPYGRGIDWNQRGHKIWCRRLHQKFKPWLLIQWTQPFVIASRTLFVSVTWVLTLMRRHCVASNCLSKLRSRQNWKYKDSWETGLFYNKIVTKGFVSTPFFV